MYEIKVPSKSNRVVIFTSKTFAAEICGHINVACSANINRSFPSSKEIGVSVKIW